MTRNLTVVAAMFLAGTAISPVLAQDIKLPTSMAFTAYDTGTSGFAGGGNGRGAARYRRRVRDEGFVNEGNTKKAAGGIHSNSPAAYCRMTPPSAHSLYLVTGLSR